MNIEKNGAIRLSWCDTYAFQKVHDPKLSHFFPLFCFVLLYSKNSTFSVNGPKLSQFLKFFLKKVWQFGVMDCIRKHSVKCSISTHFISVKYLAIPKYRIRNPNVKKKQISNKYLNKFLSLFFVLIIILIINYKTFVL